MADTNEIRFSGTIHKLYHLKTKAGNSFAKVLLKVEKDTFWLLALRQPTRGRPRIMVQAGDIDQLCQKHRFGPKPQTFNRR